MRLHWFLPTSGDSRSLVGAGQGVPQDVRNGLRDTATHGFREPTIDYLADVARTAEKLGFEGVLTPTGTFCEGAWLTTAALLRETTTLKFLVAFRPGVINPVLAAQMAAAYQRISNGRLMLNIVTGGEPVEQARFGDHAPKDVRYARTDEFLSVLRGAWHEAPFDFSGEHDSATGAMVRGGAGTALVGSHKEVAERLEEYHGLGIDEFILSGYPHVEEFYWFGEGVMPVLRRRGLLGETGATAPVAVSA